MAVAPERIKARLRAKFPKANLSKSRLDAIAAKLSQKPEDDADDAAIDELLETVNNDSVMTFEEIAKEDDRIRSIEAKHNQNQSQQSGGDISQQSQQQQQTDDTPAWAKALLQKVEALETEKKQSTIQQQLKEKLKDVDPDFYKYAALPSSVEELDAFAEGIKTDYTNFKQRLINGSVGDGKVPQGSGTSKKEASDEQISDLLNSIM